MRIHLAGSFPRGPVGGAAWDRKRFLGDGKGETHHWNLISYLDLEQRQKAVLKEIVPGTLIIDSGLFSLMFGAKQGKLPSTFEAYRDYTLKYIETMEQTEYKGFFVESDVHKLLGMDAVHRLRELFAPYGGRVIYVWHAPEGLEGLDKLALERDYIAVSVPEIRIVMGNGTFKNGNDNYIRSVWALLRRIHKVCAAAGKLPPRIHLLGCTVPELVRTPYAMTCDSTSWLVGVRYGNGFVFDHKMSQVRTRNHPRFIAWKERLMREDPTLAALAAGEATSDALDAYACLEAFVRFQRSIDKNVTPVPTRPIPGMV